MGYWVACTETRRGNAPGNDAVALAGLSALERRAQYRGASLPRSGDETGREIGYCHMEKLSNLHLLPPVGLLVSCFPYKIKGASAGFVCAVALFEEG